MSDLRIEFNLYDQKEATTCAALVTRHEANETKEAWVFRCNPEIKTNVESKRSKLKPHYRVSSQPDIQVGERLDLHVKPRFKDLTKRINGYVPLHFIGLTHITAKAIKTPKLKEKVS